MRVVHVSYAHITNYSDPEAWLKKINFYEELLKAMAIEAEVKSVHCINYSGVLFKNNVEYHFLRIKKFQMLFPWRVNRLVKSLNPDAVIVHGFHFPFKTLLLRWQLGSNVKIAIQHHAEQPLRHYKKTLQKLVDKCVSAYFFTSRNQARPWLEEMQIMNPKKIIAVMEVPSVFYPVDRVQARIKTKVENSKTYLWVGRLETNKDPITLAKAFKIFAQSNSAVHLYLIFQSFELIEEISEIIAGNEARITLIGKIDHDDLLYWYNSVDFIVSTSHYEGSGVAVCEGMSCGCIPILTNIPSFEMMTNRGECGLLFKPGDVDGLINALQNSLKLSLEDERKKVLNQYNENLSASAIASRMVGAFASEAVKS